LYHGDYEGAVGLNKIQDGKLRKSMHSSSEKKCYSKHFGVKKSTDGKKEGEKKKSGERTGRLRGSLPRETQGFDEHTCKNAKAVTRGSKKILRKKKRLSEH